MTASSSVVSAYQRTDGAYVVMEYVSVARAHVLVMSVNGTVCRRCHLAKPYKPSARTVARRWRGEDALAPKTVST